MARPTRQRPLCSPVNPRMQVLEPMPEVCFVGFPRQSVYAGRSFLPQIEERLFEKINADVVQERGEPFLLPFLCRLSYALQSVGRACPARCPERAALFRVSLGPRPCLHRLPHPLPGFVRPLLPANAIGIRPDRYCGGARLLTP